MKLISTDSFISYMALNTGLASTNSFVDSILIDATAMLESLLNTSFVRGTTTDTYYLASTHEQYTDYSRGRWYLLGTSKYYVDGTQPIVYKAASAFEEVEGSSPKTFVYPIWDYNKGYLKFQNPTDLSTVTGTPYISVTYTSGFTASADPNGGADIYDNVPQHLKTACHLQARLLYGYRKRLQETANSGKIITSPGIDTGARAVLIQHIRGLGPLYHPEIDMYRLH